MGAFELGVVEGIEKVAINLGRVGEKIKRSAKNVAGKASDFALKHPETTAPIGVGLGLGGLVGSEIVGHAAGKRRGAKERAAGQEWKPKKKRTPFILPGEVGHAIGRMKGHGLPTSLGAAGLEIQKLRKSQAK